MFLNRADGQRLYRVFQNLLQNALRYSLEGSRVYLTLTEEVGQAVVRVPPSHALFFLIPTPPPPA